MDMSEGCEEALVCYFKILSGNPNGHHLFYGGD